MINDWDIQVNVSDILGAEPVHFSWTMEKKHRKPPAERKHQESPEEPDNTTLQTVEFPSSAGSTEPVALSADISAAVPSRLVSSGLAQTEMESTQIDQTESDIVLKLQRKIALLNLCWLTASKGLVKQRRKRCTCWSTSFHLQRLKMTMLLSYFILAFSIMKH